MTQSLVTAHYVSGPTGIEISVIVPFYNAEPYIEQCAQALLAQTYPSTGYEIIMVDNNSTDRSAAIVREYPRIQLLSERKQGAYAARNRGVAASAGRTLAFTDPDCVPAYDWLSQIETAMRRSGAAVVVGSHQPARDSFLLRMLEDYENEKNNFIFSSTMKAVYYGYTNNMAVRKTLFDELGPFIEMTRGADVVFVRRCVDRYSCDSVWYAPEIRVRHMEIDSPRRYFEKVFTYGNSIQNYGDIANARSITNWERFLVFRKTVQTQNYSWPRSALLLGTLLIGGLYWICGSITGRWSG